MTAAAGVRAIGAAAVEAVERAATEAEEQLELLAPTRFERGDTRHTAAIASVQRQRAGRPPGARNLATRDVVDFVRRVFGDPMIESARWLLLTPEAMAAELKCEPAEAWDRQERIRADLRRFMYAPLAAVDDKGNVVAPSFQMFVGGREVHVAGAPPWEYQGGPASPEIQQNQPLPASAPAVSHAPVSHEVDK